MTKKLITKSFSKEKLYEYYLKCKEFYMYMVALKEDEYISRLLNIDSSISENLMRFILLKTIPDIVWGENAGDLFSITIGKIECKYFSSNGPMSFSPTSSFDCLVILDGTKLFQSGKMKLYKLDISTKDDEWKNMMVSKKDTFMKQALEKRRPRLAPSSILKQLFSFITIEYNDTIEKLLCK